ncbi:MAG TPA: FTR1 family protein [Gemmatimonadaceae bacterium]
MLEPTPTNGDQSGPESSTSLQITTRPTRASKITLPLLLASGALAVLTMLVWQAVTASGNPDPLTVNPRGPAAALDIAILVFREGLESILVLAALTASRSQPGMPYRQPIAVGVLLAMAATLLTWQIAVGVLDDLTEQLPALYVQAATGLLAVIVLVVVMNWFFHNVYWTGWIAIHTTRKKELLREASKSSMSRSRILWGLILLGFSSFYREGFEVVLFLQSYRLKLGGTPVLYGVLIGAALTAVVAVLTFVVNRRLPYRKMLVLTGVLLGAVLLVMVGEQAQEMQLAHWLPTTPIPLLERIIPRWMGLWFAIFPTVETLVAQAIAATLVLGSYGVVRLRMWRETSMPTEGRS